MKRVLGLDIGGANLKMAHTSGMAQTVPFELWKHAEKLPAALRHLVSSAPEFDEVAVTMTGELCDCFETRREGVHAIIDAVEKIRQLRRAKIWCNAGHFVDPREARQVPLEVASANWLALATFAGRFVPDGTALLVDIGSTTTDIVPLVDGLPTPSGRTDFERLESAELHYKGARRTPVCAIESGRHVAAEFFATIHDIYLLKGLVPEDPEDRATADGRPATRAHAHARLARMLGGDAETVSLKNVLGFAARAEASLVGNLGMAMLWVGRRLSAPPRQVLLSGSGEFMGRRVVKCFVRALEEGRSPMLTDWPPQRLRPRIISLAKKLGEATSVAACAYAVAVLAAERDDEP